MSNASSKLLPLTEAVFEVTGQRFHRLTIHGWRRSGKLVATRLGRQWFCRLEDVERMLREQSAPANASTAPIV